MHVKKKCIFMRKKMFFLIRIMQNKKGRQKYV